MKTRVFTRGLLTCLVVWLVVLAAQGYFRELRSTVDTLEGVVQGEEFSDWSGRESEPEGEEKRVRDQRIQAVVNSLARQEFNRDTKVRLSEIRSEFYSKLSRGEREVFVGLLLEGLEHSIGAFDQQPGDKRRKWIKQAMKAVRKELPEEVQAGYGILDAETEYERIGEAGLRAAMEEMGPDEFMEFLPLFEIAVELLQRMRIPQMEGLRGGS